jgi:hypothetical protein
MFSLALAFLILTAAAIRYLRVSEEAPWDAAGARAVIAGLIFLWPVFFAEGILRIFFTPRRGRTWKSAAATMAAGLAPPLRLGAHSRTRPGLIWLPKLGWQKIDFDLNKTLERVFSAPMSLIALMILPVLAVEYFWSDFVESSTILASVLGISIGVIWMAFTIELVLRCSVAEKKLAYLLNHWIDAAVVFLPMLEFLPFLRLLRATRVLKLQNLARLAKYYRLYGVAEKGWRGLVVVELIRHLFSRSPPDRLARLRGRLGDIEDQIRELEREADYYHRRIEAMEKELDEAETAR